MPDQKISALPAATLPLVGNEPVAVVQSGATRQAPASSFAANAVFVCTSTTRPASPFAGQVIYESDTGRSLQFQSSTTGWTPPWSTAWGELQYTAAGSAPDVQSAVITILTFGTIIVPANRILSVRFRCSDATLIDGQGKTAYAKLILTDSNHTQLDVMWRETLTGGTDSQAQAFSVGVDVESRLVGVAGAFAPQIRAVCGGSTARFGVGLSPLTGRIFDDGPAGPPA